MWMRVRVSCAYASVCMCECSLAVVLCSRNGNNEITMRSRNWYIENVEKKEKRKCEAKVRYLLSMDRRLPHTLTLRTLSVCVWCTHIRWCMCGCVPWIMIGISRVSGCVCVWRKRKRKKLCVRLNLWWRQNCCVFVFSSTFLFSFLLATSSFSSCSFSPVLFHLSGCSFVDLPLYGHIHTHLPISVFGCVWNCRLCMCVCDCSYVHRHLLPKQYAAFYVFSFDGIWHFSYSIRCLNHRQAREQSMLKFRKHSHRQAMFYLLRSVSVGRPVV